MQSPPPAGGDFGVWNKPHESYKNILINICAKLGKT